MSVLQRVFVATYLSEDGVRVRVALPPFLQYRETYSFPSGSGRSWKGTYAEGRWYDMKDLELTGVVWELWDQFVVSLLGR
jgi:hypothetical protein